MEFVRIIQGYDHLWAVKHPSKELDELTDLFSKWNNANYLLEFFMRNLDDLREFFHIEKVSQAIGDTFEDASWLRIYAVRVEPNVYVVTGGAIKLTRLMQDRDHTQLELDKLNACKKYLKDNGIFDKDSFIDLGMEDQQ